MIRGIFITFQFKLIFPKLAFIDILYYKINSSKILTTQQKHFLKYTNKAKIKYTSVSALAAKCDFFSMTWPGFVTCTASLHYSSGIENISL